MRASLDRRLGTLGVALGGALAGLGGSFAAAGGTRAFPLAGAYGLVVALTPDAVVTAGILLLGDLGDTLALSLAVALTVGVTTAAAGIGIELGRRRESAGLAAALAGAFVGIVTVALAGTTAPALLGGVAASVAAGVAVAVGLLAGASSWGLAEAVPTDRRAALGALATALGVGLLGAVARRSGSTPATETPEGLSLSTAERAEIEEELATARERSLDTFAADGQAGLDPLVSESFYEVDISEINPAVDREEWTLSITGAVREERTLDFAALRDRPLDHQFQTLRCVGERLNGHKMDNALWTGTPIAPLLEEVSPQGEYVVLRAVDDYYEEFPLAALRRGFLAYGMNGEALPRRHGYPVRALIPGHWGEINVKWLTEIEISEEPVDGYWEKRGWHGTGPVNTVAKLHAVTEREGEIAVGGHAYAGTRGIERVEVSTDGGEGWQPARLTEPLPGADVWRQWEYRYEPPAEPHEVVVRAVDGTGTVQPRERSNAFPSGATGWVSRRIDPEQL